MSSYRMHAFMQTPLCIRCQMHACASGPAHVQVRSALRCTTWQQLPHLLAGLHRPAMLWTICLAQSCPSMHLPLPWPPSACHSHATSV